MSAAYFKKKTVNDHDRNDIRKLYFGVNSEKVAERQQRQLEKKAQEPERVVAEINRYEWNIVHVKGLVEHARLRSTILGKPVEILVYKESNEAGLRPHLDLCIPAGQEVHLSLELLQNLNEAVLEARRLMNGEESKYFNSNTLKS